MMATYMTTEKRHETSVQTPSEAIKLQDHIIKGKYRVSTISHPPAAISPVVCLSLDSVWLVWSNVLTWLLWTVYIIAELMFVQNAQIISGKVLWQAWVIVTAEGFVLWPESFVSGEVILSYLLGTKNDERKRYRLDGGVVPTIDVCIACCGESVSTIIGTLAAAAAQDYPASQYRVFVLDDSASGDLREQVLDRAKKSFESSGPLITYLSRPKSPGVRHFFKAGNVRHGYETSALLGHGSEFFASLDADMIVASDWLRRIVPHLILHEKLALACPPQHFYNIPASDPLAQDSYIFARVLEPLRDRLGGASCTGSGYVLRRKAIDHVGGLPLVDVGEDIMLSYLLTGARWQIAFVKEEVQFGIAPETLSSYIKQRMRWTDGSMLISRRFYYFLPGAPLAASMSWGQRSSALLHTVSKIACVTLAFALIALPISMLPAHGNDLTAIGSDRFWLKILLLASYLMTKFNRYLVYGRVGVKNLAYHAKNKIWSTPYIAYRTVLSSIPGFDTFYFEASGSVISKADERSAIRRQALPGRMLSADILMHIIYTVVACTPLVLRVIGFDWFGGTRKLDRGYNFFPLTGALLKLLQCIHHFAVPVYYMLFPPTVPERYELVSPDEKGIDRPRNTKAKLSENGLMWFELVDLLIIYLNDWA
ncbi:MAG: hypothetical protein Q9174_003221 [Haloplaca sp. 1 TL-2023]